MERRQDAERRRRLRSVSPVVAYPETPESILPGAPRVGSLDALLREVGSLRLTLETDLSLAAAAVEAGHPAVAVDILDSDRSSLGQFEVAALGHLQDLDRAPEVTPVRQSVRASLMPIIATAAALALAFGFAPQVLDRDASVVDTAAVAAQTSLDQLQDFAAEGNTVQVRAASATLHAQLIEAIATADSDPASAQQALLLLSYERDAIAQSGNSAALHDVLVQSVALANRIRAAMPASLRKVVPKVPVIVVAQPSASASPKAKPSATASPSPAAKPSATSSPTPAAKPSATPTSSPSSGPGTGVLPSGNPVDED